MLASHTQNGLAAGHTQNGLAAGVAVQSLLACQHFRQKEKSATGFEPMTCWTAASCSTTELNRLGVWMSGQANLRI